MFITNRLLPSIRMHNHQGKDAVLFNDVFHVSGIVRGS